MTRAQRVAHRLVTQASVVVAALRPAAAPPRPGPAEHVTVVLRLPPEVAEQVDDALAPLRRAVGDAIAWSDVADLHVTVRNLDGLLDGDPDRVVGGAPWSGTQVVGPTAPPPSARRERGPDPRDVADRVVAALGAARAPRLRLAGLGMVPTGPYVRVLDVGGDLAALRHRVEEAAHVDPLVPWRRLHGVTVGRLARRLSPTTAWQAHLARGLDVGEVRPTRLEVVRTDRWLSPTATTVLAATTLRSSG